MWKAVVAAVLTFGTGAGKPQQPAARPIEASNAMGFVIQKGTERDLSVAQEGRG